ncbi:MAG TPA: DUF6183 family protein [Actinomycetota bacterium]|nr:DUF6183 family protein [Actinomycetota bacterium]
MMDADLPGTASLDDLLESAQPNPLLRRVDGLCDRRAWDELVELAVRCREAYERGKQLWPIAEHIDYRVALEAPARYAAAVLTPAAGRFAFGPLTEVAASTHSFDELVAWAPSPQVAGVLAAERVLRGEELTGRPEAHAEVLELALRLEAWEPVYPLATYKAHEMQAPAPALRPLELHWEPTAGEPLDEPEVLRALLELVSPWVSGSSGRAEASVVEGSAPAAVGALGVASVAAGEIEVSEALALMGWAAASGGAYGRRRGAAAGRSAAWWSAAVLCDLDWPVHPDVLGAELARLRWYRWEPPDLTGGWNLHLAVEDPEQGWAAAIRAEDRAG